MKVKQHLQIESVVTGKPLPKDFTKESLIKVKIDY